MAKKQPFTSQQERLERTIRNAELKIVELKELIDTERNIITAELVKVDDPTSPQVLRVSEDGVLEAGGQSTPWRDAITAEASHTGDTVETELGKITIPANKMGPNGIVRVFVICKPHAGATFRIYFGQKITANRIGYWFHASTDFYVSSRPLFVWNKNNTSAQSGEEPDDNLQLDRHFIAFGVPPNMTEDTTQDVVIYFTVINAAGGDTSYLYFALVEVFYKD